MKKLLVLVPMVVLLAAACNSSTTINGTGESNQSSGSSSQSPSSPQPAPSPAPTTSAPSETTKPASMGSGQSGSGDMSNSLWQGVLQTSDNSAKGNYMLLSGNNVIYLNTTRDFRAMIGQKVNVEYSGDMAHFYLVNISPVQ